eukprot:SAG11_NODE_3064_length_2717_cov_1.713140_3_plen_77_part_00
MLTMACHTHISFIAFAVEYPRISVTICVKHCNVDIWRVAAENTHTNGQRIVGIAAVTLSPLTTFVAVSARFQAVPI